MAKKTDKAVSELAKEIKKLRKGNEKLVEALEKAREDQAEANRGILALLEERLAARDAGLAEPAEDGTQTDSNAREPESGVAEDREQDAVQPQADGTPEAETEKEPEVTDAARRRAKELGVDVSDVRGTGSGGRILVKDVEAAVSADP